MNKNFLMINFCTEYSSEGNTEKKMRRDYCFSDVFHSEGNGVVQKNTYTIKMYKMGDRLNKDRYNNAILTDKNGIVHHLKILSSVFKFAYHLEEKEDHFILTITLDGDLIYHKYMLTWVRYLYEYPFNVFLADANRLKELPDYKFESIINLFNIVGATSGINDHGVAIHAIGDTSAFKACMTTKEIQERLKELCGGHKMINTLFPIVYRGKNYNDEVNKVKGVETLQVHTNDLHSSDYWDSIEEFNKRLELYNKNYKIIKEYKEK